MAESNTNLYTALSNIGQLQDVNGLWFNSKEITIDGYRFINCRFDSCRLYVYSSRFELVNCFIDDNTQIYYGPETLKVLKLWNSRNKAIYSFAPVYAPDRNSDGTMTIRGV